ncbi:DUF3150 domain-containing protein [Methylobacterium ajmalii]|uniref:DUF3150 domain-containing protein n=1 Tax=Methylobacterium ajmalii TaxID=2738439 RepID=UPI002F35D241
MNAQSPIAAATIVNPLATTAMLCGVRLSMWTGRKLDKDATRETNEQHEAEADASRVNKALISPEALKPIQKAITEARGVHYARTLPWEDDGLRILPAMAYGAFAAEMNRCRTKFEEEVDRFAAIYPNLVAAAQRRLGRMHKAEEFPEISRIRERFTFDVRVLPMPDAQDFRVALSGSQAAQIKRDIEDSMRSALETAMQDAWRRIIEKLHHMVDRLNGYKPGDGTTKAEGAFRDSLVLNMRDLVSVLPSFNLTQDPVLERTIQRMSAELCKHEASTLRADPARRSETAAAAQSILDDVSAYLA